MTDPTPPAEICAECRAVLGDHWMGRFWLYCSHSRVMARRRATDPQWTLDPRTSPKKAMKHLAAATAKIRNHCQQHELSLDGADAMMQRLAEKDRAKQTTPIAWLRRNRV